MLEILSLNLFSAKSISQHFKIVKNYSVFNYYIYFNIYENYQYIGYR